VWADFLADVGEEESKNKSQEVPVDKPKPKKKSWAELLGTKKSKKLASDSCSSQSKGEFINSLANNNQIFLISFILAILVNNLIFYLF